jgi:hypothetical protein
MHLSIDDFVFLTRQASGDFRSTKLLMDKPYVVELRGFEPLTSSVRLMRSPS